MLVDDTVQVPREYVKNGEIVLNISFDATSSLKLGNDFIEFKARFAGTAREIMVPVSRVIAIYARENGQGMAFPVGVPGTTVASSSSVGAEMDQGKASTEAETKVVQLVPVDNVDTLETPGTDPTPPKPPMGGRPALKRVK